MGLKKRKIEEDCLEISTKCLHVVVTQLKAVNIRNMTVKNMKFKLFRMFEASFPIPKYKIPRNNAMSVCVSNLK